MNHQFRRSWLALAALLLLCMLPAHAHAGALRPDPLQAESGCDYYRGTPIGANDSTQQFEVMLCTTPEGVRAKVQTSSLVSGWSVRQAVGNWSPDGEVVTLNETHFLESRPEPGWRFCLIDVIVLEKSPQGLSGSYRSIECDDRAQLELAKLEPVTATSTAPPSPPPSEPEREVEVFSVRSACSCDGASSTRGESMLGLLALLGLALARRRNALAVGVLALALPLSGCNFELGGLNPQCESNCTELGECGRRTYKAGDAFARCYVRNSDDCAQSRACKERGACQLYDGISPGNCVALTDLDCRQSSECTSQGKCTLGDLGRCVSVEPGPECKNACRQTGACTLRDGQCVATSTDDCRSSNGCARAGRCTLEGDRCVAANDADCAGSQMCKLNGWCHATGGDGCYDGRTECGQLCWERGDCKRIDGTCQPGDESSCKSSLACIVLGQCSVTGRPAVMCGADEDADCEQSLECKAFGRCEVSGIACASDNGRSPSSSVGCLRDPECATKGRCLTDDNGRCVTALEAGLPDWKPSPPLP